MEINIFFRQFESRKSRKKKNVERIERKKREALLLLGNTHRLAAAAGRARVLSTHSQAVRVTNPSVGTDLLQPLQLLAKPRVDNVAADVLRHAGLGVALSVQEPVWDFILRRGGNDVGHAVELLWGQRSCSAVVVNVRLFADDMGEANPDTFHHTQGKCDFPPSIDVGVEQTHNVLE